MIEPIELPLVSSPCADRYVPGAQRYRHGARLLLQRAPDHGTLSPMAAAGDGIYRLFVYGTLLEGEADHGLLGEARAVATATTRPIYKLVELNAAAGLLDRGDTAVVGEIYEVDAPTLARCDLRREHPVLYERRRIELEDGSAAWTYFLRHEQARGLRRIRGGDWRKRFATAPSPTREASAFARWARSRYKP